MLGGEIADVLESFAALEKGLAIKDEAFEFDRTHFRAVLFVLAFLLPVFVVFEVTLQASGLFVEEIGHVPENVVQFGLKARVAQSAAKDVEEVRDCAGKKVRFGKWAGIWLRARGLVAVEFEVFDDASGCGIAMGGFEVVSGRHWFMLLEVGGRPLRP